MNNHNHTYLLEENIEYKILILYIFNRLNNDIKRKIYDILVTFEIIYVMEQAFTELIVSHEIDILDLYELDLYSD